MVQHNQKSKGIQFVALGRNNLSKIYKSIQMKKITTLFVLCFALSTSAQNLGLKTVLELGNYNSKSYGVTYEKNVSAKRLISIETGLYLNFKNYKKDTSYNKPLTGYFFNGTDTTDLIDYTKKRKIRAFHIPILFKKYFYIKSAVFFISAGPQLALKLSDKIIWDTDSEGIIKTEKPTDEFKFINFLINIGFEYKKLQFSIRPIPSGNSFASFSIGYVL